MNPYLRSGPAVGACPVLLTSPHSGTHLPAAFLKTTRLPVSALRRIEDSHVGALLAQSVVAGLPLLEATHSRAYLDLNRSEQEFDPAMLSGPSEVPALLTERVRRGYGLLPRVAAPNQAIYPGRIPPGEVEQRLRSLHTPWHAAISGELDASIGRHGFAILLDCHSMPTQEGAQPPALVLGDLHGQSAAPELVNWLEDAFATAGLKVARNIPYAGGHTTERHASPTLGRHVVQLEFDRRLYMNLETLRPHAGFEPLAATISKIAARLLDALPTLAPYLVPARAQPLAAE